MKYICITLFLYFISVIGVSLKAQIGGNSTYKFLNLPAPARIAAMGGTLIAIKDNDLNLGYYNPSVINPSMDKQLVVNNTLYFRGINFGYVAYAKDYGNIGTFALGTQYISYGRFIKADAIGEHLGNFFASEFAIQLGWGRSENRLSYGANLKLISSFLESYNSFGIAVDVAGTYTNEETGFTISLVLKNIGYQIKPYIKENREPLPFEIQMGISQKLEHLPLRLFITAHNLQQFDIRYNDPNAQQNSILQLDSLDEEKDKKYLLDKIFRHIVFGGEFSIGNNLKLRLGYNYFRRKEMAISTKGSLIGFSWGIGMMIKKIKIEYARSSYHLAGGSNHITIAMNMNEVFKKTKSNTQPNNTE